MAVTLQNNIKNFTDGELTKYALFLGGANVTQDALSHYDPLKGGFGRLFMIRQPVWVKAYFEKDGKMKVFKHILEYANTSINGLQSITVDSQQMTGGYAQRNINIPTSVTDGMDNFSVTVYEFSGSPVREVLHTWINGSIDIQSGLTTYYSNRGGDSPISNLKRSQANQTAEFIYVMTDHTGEQIEYACMLANCFPTAIDEDPFNYTAGQHELIQTTINFNCVKYESLQINEVAKALITRYKILTNSLNFHSGFNVSELDNAGTMYDITDGQLKEDPQSAPYENAPGGSYKTDDAIYFTANTPTNNG